MSGNVTMDLNGIEHIQLNALGGADNITVNDLSGTGVTQVAIDLASPPGSGVGDLAADSVTVKVTKGDDVIEVQGRGGSLTVAGLSELVTISGSEAIDALVVAAGNGNDTLSAAMLFANTALTLDGGAGNDTIIGSQGADQLLGGDGNDVVTGGRGNDTALLGNGNDTFIWNPATAATSSKVRPAPIRSYSTAPTSARTWISPPTASACASPAISAPSPWTSTGSRGFRSTPQAARTTSRSTISTEPA